jgi:hypothetical protein
MLCQLRQLPRFNASCLPTASPSKSLSTATFLCITLSSDILRVSVEEVRSCSTSVRCRRLIRSLLNYIPKFTVISLIISAGSHSGNVHGVIVECPPVVGNLFLSCVFKRLSRWAHTGQHSLDTPIVCPLPYVVNWTSVQAKHENKAHWKFPQYCIVLDRFLRRLTWQAFQRSHTSFTMTGAWEMDSFR